MHTLKLTILIFGKAKKLRVHKYEVWLENFNKLRNSRNSVKTPFISNMIKVFNVISKG